MHDIAAVEVFSKFCSGLFTQHCKLSAASDTFICHLGSLNFLSRPIRGESLRSLNVIPRCTAYCLPRADRSGFAGRRSRPWQLVLLLSYPTRVGSVRCCVFGCACWRTALSQGGRLSAVRAAASSGCNLKSPLNCFAFVAEAPWSAAE